MSIEEKSVLARQKKMLAFRPATYWPESLNREQLLARIKGQARRDAARHALEEGGIAVLHELYARSELLDDQRQAFSALHPVVMGGEFLPSLEMEEVEIARIHIASVTGDQHSIRARFEGGKIRYRVLDEYNSKFDLAFDCSDQPLSLGELVEFIDGSRQNGDAASGGLMQSHWNWALESESPPEEAIEFAGISSAWYPDLADWFDSVAVDWLDAHIEQ